MNYQRNEFNQNYKYINKLYQSINAILIFIIQKLDILNSILGIAVIYAYIYNKIYFSILDTILIILRNIRGIKSFLMCLFLIIFLILELKFFILYQKKLTEKTQKLFVF